eukprot:13088864-Alexandrium_andersonii.AAC.1
MSSRVSHCAHIAPPIASCRTRRPTSSDRCTSSFQYYPHGHATWCMLSWVGSNPLQDCAATCCP